MSKISNHEKAPQCAAFVKLMREVFGQDLKVLYVKEGDFQLGESSAGSVPFQPPPSLGGAGPVAGLVE